MNDELHLKVLKKIRDVQIAITKENKTYLGNKNIC